MRTANEKQFPTRWLLKGIPEPARETLGQHLMQFDKQTRRKIYHYVLWIGVYPVKRHWEN